MRKILKEAEAITARRAIEKARRAAVSGGKRVSERAAIHATAPEFVVLDHLRVPTPNSEEKSRCCGAPLPANNQVQLESSYLNARMIACPVYLRTPVQPESVRINALMQSTINAYGSATDPAQRFVEYQGPVIPPACPPVDPNIFNASQGFRQIICPQPRNYYSGL